MSWFRVDDTLCGHQKAQRAGKALALWVMCGSHVSSAAGSGDGSLDMFEIESIALSMRLPEKEWRAYVTRLLEVGLWDRVHGSDRVRFHDWHDYASSDGALASRRAKDAERARKSREKRATSRDASQVTSRDESDASRDGGARVTRALARVSRDPVPSRPVPSRAAEGACAPTAAAPLPDLAGEILSVATRLGLPVDAEFADALALIAERGGRSHLVAKALDEAAGAVAARAPLTVQASRDLIQRFVRRVRPDEAPLGQGGSGGSGTWRGGRHGAPGAEEPYNPFGPPTDEELRAAGVIP